MAKKDSKQETPEPAVNSGIVTANEPIDRQTQPVDTEQPPRLSFPVVGIGASAGGLEAITDFLSKLRTDSGMAYVFIQHLPPTGESMLVDILSKRTTIPVLHVDDQMKVEPDRLYVIRPGQTLTIGDGAFHLGERLATPMHNRPVDDFFKSLAAEQRERGIAIIMSGMGSNGAAGAQAIKAVGGLCIAQDPDTTDYPSMPRHLIDAGYADYILRSEDMPGVLLEYAGHPYAKGQREEKADLVKRDQQHVREILAVLRTRTHQDFNGYKKPTVLRRIQRRMGLNRITRIGEYAKLLRQTPAEVTALADDLLIHVTGFFRDAQAWESLRQRIIVPLIASRHNDETVRCWVTACSSGEEAYTLAMLLVEEAERTNKFLDIKVFATDMAERSLQNARNGIYTGGIESEITADRLDRFFTREEAVYRVRPELRERVVFAPQNLLQDPPFSRLDIVSCRNLLIYLEPEMQARILGLLHFGLREGGTLFLGTSETVNSDDLFEPIDKQARLYRRIGPTRHGTADFPEPHSRRAAPSAETAAVSARAAGPRPSITQMFNRALVEHHTPAAVIIDREQRIVFYHGNTEPFISLPRGEPTRHLMDVVRESVRGAVRIAVQRARANDDIASVLDGWIEIQPDKRVRIAVTVSPLDRKNAPGHLVVSFQERGEVSSENAAVQQEPKDPGELQRMREELQSTIEELQTSNEELKASHEEVVSTNEELQSTNEELETSREEMQSLNEELSTVNAQLRAKMEEQQIASNDLTSLLTSTDIAVLFLDPRLRIRRFTPRTRELLDMINTDVGRPLADLNRKFTDPDLDQDAQSVLERLVPIERQVQAANDRFYLRRVLPYRTADNHIDGLVITFVDITDRRQIEQELEAARQTAQRSLERLERIMNIPLVGVLIFDASGALVEANDAFFQMTGYTRADVAGRTLTWQMMTPPEYIQISNQQMDVLKRTGLIGPYEKEYLRKDGTRSWMLFAGAAMSDGAIVEYCIDVNDRKIADQIISDSEEQLRLIFEGAHDFAIITLDPAGKITSWNIGAERLIGFSSAEVTGHSGDIIFTHEDRAAGAPERELRTALSAGRVTDERWHIGKSGERFWGSGVMTALRNPDGSVRSLVKIMRNETVRKHAEEVLQAAKESAEQANRMKDDFLASLSHELRTPLSAILLWSKILDISAEPNQLAEGLRAIRNSAEAQKELVEDLLDMSRITMGALRLRIREVELEPLMREILQTIQPIAAARQIIVESIIPADLGMIRVDPDRLRQVVWNLLTNATKFTPEGGRVSLRVSRRDNKVEIQVADTGQGISPEFLPHVFERFRQANPTRDRAAGGIGIGLAIAKQLVELHGGQISVQSAGFGKGSTFTVRLPVPPIEKTAARMDAGDLAAAQNELRSMAGTHVLLIEDDAATRQALTLFLKEAGIRVTDVPSASEALASYRKSPPQLIISDIGLPGEDGYTLIRRIRAYEKSMKLRQVPAVALTAFARDTDRRIALDAGFQSHIGKPIDPYELARTLRELLKP